MFRRSAAWFSRTPDKCFRSTKIVFPEVQNTQALYSQCFHLFWRPKHSFRSTKIMFPCLRDAQKTINLVRLNQVDMQESSIRHQVNTFRMCPDGVSCCNGVPLIKIIVLVQGFQKCKTHRHYTHNAFIAFGNTIRFPLNEDIAPMPSGCEQLL